MIARCVARRTDLRAVGLEDITPHYAETLRRWRRRFERRDRDDAARRSATTSASGGCGGSTSPTARPGFRERRIGDVQLLLAKPRWRGDLPAPAAPWPSPRSSKLPELGADVSGSGEPLLLVHGIGGTRRIWDPVVAPLAAEFEVIAVDLPGFGESAPLQDGATPDPPTLAGILAHRPRARGIATAHLAGSSLGAWIALELARLGRARSVTSLCAAGFWSRPLLADGELPRKPARAIARALLPAMGPLLRTRRGRRVVLGMNMAHPERVTHAEALDIVRAYATAPGYPATNLAMRRTSFQGARESTSPSRWRGASTTGWCVPRRCLPGHGGRCCCPTAATCRCGTTPTLVVRVIRATARPT